MEGPDKPSSLSESNLSITTDSGKPTAAAMSSPAPPSSSSSSSPAPSPASSSSPSSNHTSASPTAPRAHAPSTSPSAASSSSTVLPPPEPSYMDALRTLKPSDLKSVHQKPCARESLLTGIGAGFGIGGLRFILGSGVPFQARQYRAMSWAVGAFVLTSAGAHAFCQRRRTLEKNAMARANAIMEEKRKAKQDEANHLREQRRKELEREEREGGLWKWVGWR